MGHPRPGTRLDAQRAAVAATAAMQIARKSLSFNDAPPIRPPSISSWLNRSSAFLRLHAAAIQQRHVGGIAALCDETRAGTRERPRACCAVALLPVPIAHTGSYATTSRAASSTDSFTSTASSCSPTICSVDHPRALQAFRRRRRSASTLLRAHAASSQRRSQRFAMIARRSECPTIAYDAPNSAAISAATFSGKTRLVCARRYPAHPTRRGRFRAAFAPAPDTGTARTPDCAHRPEDLRRRAIPPAAAHGYRPADRASSSYRLPVLLLLFRHRLARFIVVRADERVRFVGARYPLRMQKPCRTRKTRDFTSCADRLGQTQLNDRCQRPAPQLNTILPTCVLLSINSCACGGLGGGEHR